MWEGIARTAVSSFFSIYIAGTKDTHETSTYIVYLAVGMGTPVLPFVLLIISTTVFWFLHIFPFLIKNSWSLLILALEPHLEKKKNPKQNKTKQKKTKTTTHTKKTKHSPPHKTTRKHQRGKKVREK